MSARDKALIAGGLLVFAAGLVAVLVMMHNALGGGLS